MALTKLYDNHGRHINYVRLAVTDRCNLRCFYCMPEEGIKYVSKEALLSYEEMLRLMHLLADMGIEKVRITGGEPFVRRDMIYFLRQLCAIEGIKKVNITTNGTLTEDLVPELKSIGINSVNLSLDALDKDRFFEITRRDAYDKVMATYRALLEHNMPTKINAVVMDGKNIEDIIPMAMLTQKDPVSVRFIEEMPFNGEGAHYETLAWNHRQILKHLQASFPDMEKLPDPPYSTSYNYQIPGHKGSVGIIAAYSRTFCGTCNRIRITPKGMLKTCLYDDGVFNIRDIMRQGATDAQLKSTFREALGNRAKDGWEAERNRSFGLPVQESMSTIGG
ncbi:MAG: GTP 3',8-cyclase MoaA [Phaeodactylibacter xiamenensis]|uniref:GTP 3',8-cyclase n=1 Tax=Phaeodactylibacter xiamenensis TaxID=1524460 RepID=A0A098S7T8_9BACT|nr:GTP 3',8-cyclase MoaA [Phaeodactylibacter xiamenensis]KGE88166.1 molybdenum cofactor biosynthesis protein MoaA [Phaeodactylibacter xiamenensis]MCR9054221.1 GTP 3',8-cyclase MoaA [bacterium]